MIRVCLSAALALLMAAPLSGQTSQPVALLDVPFLSQSEALCGGAAAAMVLRYWGERGVAADDFAPLVDRRAGGIRPRALVDALRARGWTAREMTGGDDPRRELTRGHPLIALIEDRPRTYHYVVVVGWHEQAVVVHDPARAPFRVMTAAEFDRRWRAADRWSLALLPPSQKAAALPPSQNGDEQPVSRDGGRTAQSWDGGSGGRGDCHDAVQRGIALAQKNDLAGADRTLTDAVYRCGGAAAYRELAGVRLLQRRWPEVSDLAREALRLDEQDQYSARLLAASRLNQDDVEGALAAWNRAGEPSVDLVTIDGLVRTRFRVVEQYIGLPRQSLLTAGRLRRARVRLSELPAAAATNVTYAPVTERTAELRVSVLERPPVPRGVIGYAAIGARAAVQRELTIPMASLSGGGELLAVSWRFWPDRPRYSAAFSAPFAIGAVSVSAYRERQPFSSTAVPSERAGGALGLAQWTTDRIRWSGRAGGDRWRDRGTFGALGGDVRIRLAHATLAGGATAWAGPSPFGEANAHVDWRSSTAPVGTVLVALAGVQQVSRHAPLDLWPAGDTGHARDQLLRAHPVLDGGMLRVERLGRMLTHASVGVQRWWPAGPVRVGVEGFIDIARTSGGRAPLHDADPGAGLRLAFPGVDGVFQMNVAHGLQDRQNALSFVWTRNP